MSIRLVNDKSEVLWFTSTDWRRVLEFARTYGWEGKAKAHPDEWGESVTFDERWEIVGGAHIASNDSGTLADAVARGLADPDQKALQALVDGVNELFRIHFPGRHITPSHFSEPWKEFVEFAHKGGFRVDLTD